MKRAPTVLAALAVCFALLISTPGVVSAAIPAGMSVTLETFAVIPSADGAPQDIASANDGTGRLFVSTRNGKIDILSSTGTLSGTPFLNLTTAGVPFYNGGEGGFSGIAFSPNYATNGKFYTFDTESFSTTGTAADFGSPEMFPTTAVNPNNQIAIREWTVSAASPNLANTSSRELLRINHPDSNHQGGSLKFGSDGNLYIGLGDGGGANDFNGSAGSTTDGHNNTVGNGQDTSVPFGKILRIDPNGSNSANGKYGIPATNPFSSGSGGMKEIYAYGFRNPYRFSFDSSTGDFWVGDVGQGNREEIDKVTLVSGAGNYGWPFREGTRDNTIDSGRAQPSGFSSIAPVGEYTHADGIAVIGGFVYRGTAIPALVGKYVFGDLEPNTGRLFYMDTTTGVINEFQYLGNVTPTSNLYGFGEDQNHELYAAFSNGNILTFVPEPSSLALTLIAVPCWLLRKKFAPGSKKN